MSYDTPPLRQSNLSDTKQALLEKRLRGLSHKQAEQPQIPRRTLSEPAPLSFAQQRFWVLDQWLPENPVYIIPIALSLIGPLNVAKLEESILELQRRHETLRTTFTAIDGIPKQVVAPATVIKADSIRVIDFSRYQAEQREQYVQNYIAVEAHRPFHLQHDFPLRAQILRLSQEEHILLLVLHHIAADAWSMSILQRELRTLYESFSNNMPPALPPLPIQYTDFAVWQRQPDFETRLQQRLTYWRHQLAQLPILELPTDFPRPAVESFRGATYLFTLPDTLHNGLKAVSRSEDVTLFMTLLTAFLLLLMEYSRQEDLVIGTPTANRAYVELESLIGSFTNTLVLRADLSGQPTIHEALQRIRDVTLEAYTYQDVPFERLVEELQPERDLSRNPLCQVFFQLHHLTEESTHFTPDLKFRQLPIETATAKADLSLDLIESAKSLRGKLVYNTDLFSEERIEHMVAHFLVLLEALTTVPTTQRITDVSLLNENERQQTLIEWNATQTGFQQEACLHELVDETVIKTPDAVAIVHKDHCITYEVLQQHANQIAHYLQKHNVGPETRVGLYVERTLEMAIGLLGILKAGGAYLPLDIAYPRERIAYLLADAQLSLLLTQKHLVETLPTNYQAQLIYLDTDWKLIEQEPTTNPLSTTTLDNLAYIIYTSGSTGKPKGVLVPHKGCVNHNLAISQLYYIGPTDRYLQFSSISFDVAEAELFPAWINGATSVLRPDASLSSLADFLNWVEREQLTIVNLPTAYWHEWVSELAWSTTPPPPSLRQVIVGTEKALPERLDAWKQYIGDRIRWCNAYGPTEASIATTVYRLLDDPTHNVKGQVSIPIGRPIANAQVYLLTPNLQPVPVGLSGEIYIGGRGLAHGYLNHAGLTAERFIPNPFSTEPGTRLYKTGDFARFLPTGNIDFLGRIDHQIKLRGYRIELGEIESELATHPAVHECVVITYKDAAGNHNLIAYITPEVEQRPAEEQLRQYLKERLPHYMIPSSIVFLEKLPMTTSGKIDRFALPQTTGVSNRKQTVMVEPRTPVEAFLAETWRQLLGGDRIDIHTNFFHIGGHSLLAIQVISRLKHTFNVDIPLRSIFEAPTIAQLAQYVEQAIRQNTSRAPQPIPAVKHKSTLPLSFTQERLWFLDQWVPNSSLYNIPLTLHLTGKLDLIALQYSLAEILRRHEILRTRFQTLKNGEPYQFISEETALPLVVIELTLLTQDEQFTHQQSLLTQVFQQPFQLAQELPLRIVLLCLSSEEYILHISLHHIVADAWSMRIFQHELEELYKAFLQSQPDSLAALPIQYADFALWQRSDAYEQEIQPQLDYWRKRLEFLPVLDIGTDFTRPDNETFRGATYRFHFKKDLRQQLHALSQREGVTLFMTLLTGFQLLLMRYSNQDEIVVGTPSANRSRIELEPLIGCFINTLVLCTDFSDQSTIHQALQRVRQVTLEAYAHQDVPFERLVEALQIERDTSRNPLYQVLFQLHQASDETLKLPGLTLRRLPSEIITAKLDLSLTIVESAQGLVGQFEYNTDLFMEGRIQRMAEHLQVLLEGMSSMAPDRYSSELPLLSSKELQQLLIDWNATGSKDPSDTCFHRLFEAQTAQLPDAIALVFEQEQLTYSELDRRANQLAHFLHKAGVRPETTVGLCIERSLKMVVGILGILKAGGAYVPLDPQYPAERLAFLLRDSQIDLLLTQEAFLDTLPDPLIPIICLDRDWNQITHQPVQPLPTVISPDNLAYVIYTSGSTGLPKGVGITHQSAIMLLYWARACFGAEQLSSMLAVTSICFDLSVFELFAPLSWGGKVVIAPHAFQLLQLATSEDIAFINTVPSVLTELLRTAPLPASVQTVSLAGEHLPRRLVNMLYRSPSVCRVFNLYGPTEDTTYSTSACISRTETDPVPIGSPITNTQAYVLDQYMQPVPIGVPGELYLGGEGLARGYLRRPSSTAERFVPDSLSRQPGKRLYRTGDLVRYQANGALEYLGRLDHQVKLRGFRIELGEIESVLATHPEIERALVIARTIGEDDKQLVAYLRSQQHVRPAINTLRGWLQERLPNYMVPSYFVYLDELPLTPNGKIDRQALPPPDEFSQRTTINNYVAPRTDLERQLVAIWEQVLGHEQIGIHDSFFTVGGHSLMATRVVAQIRDTLYTALPLRALFETPTIADLARTLEALALQTERSTPQLHLPVVVPNKTARYQPFPLTDTQQAYWIGRSEEFELGNVATHIYQEFESTQIDLERFNLAWQQLIERHEMLRTIVLLNGQQQIIEQVPFYRIEITDLSDHNPTAVEHHLAAIRHQMSHQVLPSDRWPLFEIRATHLLDGRLRIHMSIDALICDASSLRIISGELAKLYHDPQAALPLLSLSFRDYVIAEQALQSTDLYQQSQAYWWERLATLPSAPMLSLSKDPSEVQQPRFTRRSSTLDKQEWQKLKERAAQMQMTPSGVLLAAFAEVLTVWSQNAHFLLTLTLFNRLPLHPQVNDIVGDFTSLMLLEVDNRTGATFRERASQLQERLWNDLDHRYISGVRVLRELSRRYIGGRRIKTPIVFTSVLEQESQRKASRLSLGKTIYGISQTPQVWLDHQVVERQDTLFFNWDTVDELFPARMLDDMFASYSNLLQRLSKEDQTWNEIAPIVLPSWQQQLTTTMNATMTPLPTGLLHTILQEQAATRPQAAAIITTKRTVTYEQLFLYANHLGRALLEQGARPNTLVAIVMEKGWEQVAAAMGTLTAGAAYLPIDASLPKERLWHLLHHGQVKSILTQSWINNDIEWPAGLIRICVDTLPLTDLDRVPLKPVQLANDLAYVIYTSGSTGQPKGVMIDHRGALNTIVDINQRFQVGPNDRILALSSLSFDLSVYDLFGMLHAGGCIIILDAAESRNPAHWLELLKNEQVTLWNSVPALMNVLVEYINGHKKRLPQLLRLVLLSGDWIPVTLPGQLHEHNPTMQVISLGGATEASIWSILYPIGTVNSAWKSIPYGRPMLNQWFYILDERMETCPIWVPGRLYIGGSGLALGYWRDEEKTRDRFIHHPRTGERLYHTGDLGRYLPDGNIEFMGREDFQVKIQGYRVELEEIEAHLLQHPGLQSVVVSTMGTMQGEKRLVAYFVPKSGQTITLVALRQFLQERLPDYMVPSTLVLLDHLPLTTNGKVDRSALATLTPQTEVEPIVEQPQTTGVVEQVRKIVLEVLNLPDISLQANLLELGANSVDMIRIANRCELQFAFRPKISTFYRTPTITALVSLYEQHQSRQQSLIPQRSNLPSGLTTLPVRIPLLRDPVEREQFKKQLPGVRQDEGSRRAFQFNQPQLDDTWRQRYKQRRSYRHFTLQPIPLEDLGNWLSCLQPLLENEQAHYLYASAGSLYPIQTYIHVKTGRVAGLPAGVYYYHPLNHHLVLVSAAHIELDRNIHETLINQPTFDEAAFSIFLIAQFSAIAPIYGDQSTRFAYIEAGMICQLLETAAVPYQIGLCQIGTLDFAAIQHHFALDASHVLIHSLVGGCLDDHPEETMAQSDQESKEQKVNRLLERVNQLTEDEVQGLLAAHKQLREERQ